MYVDVDIKVAGKQQNIDPLWKVIKNEVVLGEPTGFFNNLGCFSRQSEISKGIFHYYRAMLEFRISAGATENYHVRSVCLSFRGLMTWRVTPRNVWNYV